MTTTPAPTKAEIAGVLNKAADHLDRVGLTKGYLYDEDQADAGTPRTDCRVCAVGAINVAVHGLPSYSVTQVSDEQQELGAVAQEALAAHLDLGTTTVPQWNDAKARQKRQVVKAFRDTAASLWTGVSS